jgi:hypothetical protein
MPVESVPEELRRFILTSIPSIPFLEALLLLKGEPRDWTLNEVGRRLYMSDAAARETLQALEQSGMASSSAGDTYRFRPANESLRALVDQLAETYARDLIGVTTLVHSGIGKSAQVFADAFKIRKDS